MRPSKLNEEQIIAILRERYHVSQRRACRVIRADHTSIHDRGR